MSDFCEAVIAALSGEWQTTAEIASRIPRGDRSYHDHDALTRHHLKSLVRYGMAENRKAPATYRWVHQWRRRA